MWSTFSIFGAIFCILLASTRVETAARAPREATPCPPGSSKRAGKAPPRRPRTLPRAGTGSPRPQHFGLSLSKSLMSAPLPPGPATPAPPPAGRRSLGGLAHASRPASGAPRPVGRGRRWGRGVPRTAPRRPWWAAQGRGGVGARHPAADTLFQLGPCVACASCSAAGAGRSARTSFALRAASAGRQQRGCAQEQLRNAPWAPALSARRAG